MRAKLFEASLLRQLISKHCIVLFIMGAATPVLERWCGVVGRVLRVSLIGAGADVVGLRAAVAGYTYTSVSTCESCVFDVSVSGNVIT